MEHEKKLQFKLVIIAALAALFATIGDLLMLYASNARILSLHLTQPPEYVLIMGAYLGVIFIPLYIIGYWIISRNFSKDCRKQGRIFFYLGAVGSMLGAVIHGMTGVIIYMSIQMNVPAMHPLEGILAAGIFLIPLWVIAALAVMIASIIYFRTIIRGQASYPSWMAVMNPLVLTIFFVLISIWDNMMELFVLPAAPNIAHLVFFCAAASLYLKNKYSRMNSL